MNEQLMEPLRYYEIIGRQTHSENAKRYFDELLIASGVDEAANRATVKAYKEELQRLKKAESKLRLFKALRIILIVLSVIGAIACVFGILTPIVWLIIVGALVPIASLIVIFVKLNKTIKMSTEIRDKLKESSEKLLSEAREQMAPLNALFDDTDTFKLIEQTMPEISFSKYLSSDQRELLRMENEFNDSHNANSSTVNTVSGDLFKNPFVFSRKLIHRMGNETYHGTLLISWTETYRDSQGKTQTRTRTQTLHASVVKPKPFYHTESRLCYGSEAAPKLSFSRKPIHVEDMSEKERQRKIRSGEKKLKKKSRKELKGGGSFQEMSNSEFDVLFGAVDRDNEVEFRLMYTPLAQKNTLSLMESQVGFGDDFEFSKVRELNIIKSEHAQSWTMNTSASNYYSYDIDTARTNFERFNSEYFKSVFFDFAPLISIPAYTEEPLSSYSESNDEDSLLSAYEHEVMANAIGQAAFAHKNSRTDVILKTRCLESSQEADLVEVSAFSYVTFDRVDFVPVRGGDGNWHSVPVHWVEYIPVSRVSQMSVSMMDLSEKEFRDLKDKTPDAFEGETFFGGMVAKQIQIQP